MSIKHVQKTYEDYGQVDPLYAVLSCKDEKNNRWDVERFFETGQKEIRGVMKHLRSLGAGMNRSRAMDFGCGVGRLTQALCEEFELVIGIDISSSMIAKANELNQFGDRCQYRVNTSADLTQLATNSFDFVYSNISLQHTPPESSANYIAEFFRILKPGGVAFFQIPSGPRHEPGSIGTKIYAFKHGPLRRFWKRLRGLPTVEMHYIHHSLVERIIKDSGAKLIDSNQYGSVRSDRVSMFYCARLICSFW